MSWTNECTESNEFKVKNTEEVREVFELLGFTVYKNKDNGKLSFVSNGEGSYYDDNTEVVLSNKPIEINGKTKNLIGIISDCVAEPVDIDTITDDYGVKEGEYTVMPIEEYLQDQLEVDNAIVITTCGYDERCAGKYNPFGYALIIAKNKNGVHTSSMSLSQYITETCNKLGVEE